MLSRSFSSRVIEICFLFLPILITNTILVRNNIYIAVTPLGNMAYLGEKQREYLQTGRIPKNSAKRKLRSDLRKKIKNNPEAINEFVQDMALIEEGMRRGISLNIPKTKCYPVITLLVHILPYLGPEHCKILEQIVKFRVGLWQPNDDKDAKKIWEGVKAIQKEYLGEMGMLEPIDWLEKKPKTRRILSEIASKTGVTKTDLQKKLNTTSISIGRMIRQLMGAGLVVCDEKGNHHITNKGKLVASWFKRSGD